MLYVNILKVLICSLTSCAALFLIAKIMGHKQVAQLGFFDYICGITIGSMGAELATELEEPQYPLIALGVYGAVSVLLSIIMSKAAKTRKYINGTPTVIMRHGKLYRENMKKARLDLSEFLVMCRQRGYFDLSDIDTAIFEFNGMLSILPRSVSRPVTPRDMLIAPKRDEILAEVIMDGKILEENLTRMGLDVKWLNEQLHKLGYESSKMIFLALCDTSHKLTVYERD